MKVAYLILAHRNPKQFNNRTSINWGGYTMLEATLNLIKEAKSNKKYDYYVLLSGDDYLIKNEIKFINFLSENSNYSFLEYESFEQNSSDLMTRYNRYILFEKKSFIKKVLQKLMNIIISRRKMYNNMEALKGSQWWCLNTESIDYVLNYLQSNPKCLKYFKHTHIPDEMFFQTIIGNSHLKEKVINDNLRYIRLEGFHPDILTQSDLNYLVNSKRKFFARKFDTNIDEKILDLLDRYIEQ